MVWLVKLIFILMLLPFFVSLALQLLSTTLQAILGFLLTILPWLIGFAVLIAVVAGLIAGSRLSRRLPLRNDRYFPAQGRSAAIKRPKGRGRGDD